MTIWTNVSRVIFVIIIYYHCNWHKKLDKERNGKYTNISKVDKWYNGIQINNWGVLIPFLYFKINFWLPKFSKNVSHF